MSPFVSGSIAAVAIAGALGIGLSMHQSTPQPGRPHYRAVVQVPTPALACALSGTSPAGPATAPAQPTPACEPLQFGPTAAP